LDIGFKVLQDIVTVNDTSALYDNQNSTPNVSAPGADRYRIRLVLSSRDDIDSDENFVYLGRIEKGKKVDQVEATDNYNVINDLMALRTKEESGNYNVKPFKIRFENNATDTSKLNLNISDGISYINGYRAAVDYPSKLLVAKARGTKEIENEATAANFGNYLISDSCAGIYDLSTFPLVNLRNAFNYGGATIGTARVRAIDYENSIAGGAKHFLFAINMNASESIRNVKSFGTSVSSYSNVSLENGKAVLKNTGDHSLLFNLPRTRAKSLTDISYTAQRTFVASADSAGEAAITVSAGGETFANTSDWVIAADSNLDTSFSVVVAGGTSATISGLVAGTSHTIQAYVNKAQATARVKTLSETTVTGAIESDGNGLLFLDLGLPDIYSVTRIRAVDSDGIDLTDRFTLDNGQRDNYYGLGKLNLNGGATQPSGNVFARFNYFTHSSTGDFFSVNSYSGQVEYEDIQSYTKNNAEIISLRDVLDFRPVQNTSGTFSGGAARVNELPEVTGIVTADITYYTPRYARLVINENGQLKFVNGISSLDPKYPDVPSNSLLLYDIQLNPFTFNDSDITISYNKNRRYTMYDISKLEKRIDKLEELTTLSLLELDTSSLTVLDSDGVARTKAGFLVDNFKDFAFSDTSNYEWRASIDPKEQIMRPRYNSKSIRMIYDSDKSTNTILKGDNVYLKYNEVAYLSQTVASGTETVNPYSVTFYEGAVELSPASDTFYETQREPTNVINGGNYFSTSTSDNWRLWEWNWSGTTATTTGSLSTSTSTSDYSSGTVSTVETVYTSEGDRVIDTSLIPWMRSIKIYFKAQGLKPNSRVFPYFNGENVDAWCREETFQRYATDTTIYGNDYYLTEHPQGQSALYTDANGAVEGSFYIPFVASIAFLTGTTEFKLLDISKNDNNASTTIAATLFRSQGYLTTVQETVVSTRYYETTTVTNPEAAVVTTTVADEEGTTTDVSDTGTAITVETTTPTTTTDPIETTSNEDDEDNSSVNANNSNVLMLHWKHWGTATMMMMVFGTGIIKELKWQHLTQIRHLFKQLHNRLA